MKKLITIVITIVLAMGTVPSFAYTKTRTKLGQSPCLRPMAAKHKTIIANTSNYYIRRMLAILYIYHEINNVLTAITGRLSILELSSSEEGVTEDFKKKIQEQSATYKKIKQRFFNLSLEVPEIRKSFETQSFFDSSKKTPVLPPAPKPSLVDQKKANEKTLRTLISMIKDLKAIKANMSLPTLPNEAQQESVERIRGKCDTGIDILDVFISYLRTGILPLKPQEVDLNGSLKDRDFFDDVEFSDVKIIYKLDPSIPKMYIDRRLLTLIIKNIQRNAYDAMEAQTKKSKLRFTVKTSIEGEFVKIELSDNGCGIAKEDIPHIYDLFYTKGKKHGTGIGLALVEEAVTQLKGSISVDSEVGKGTTFTLLLPISAKTDTTPEDIIPSQKTLATIEEAALRPMAARMTGIEIAETDTRIKYIKEMLFTLEHFKVINDSEKRLLEIIALEKLHIIKDLRNKAFDEGIIQQPAGILFLRPSKKHIFAGFLKPLFGKRLIMMKQNTIQLCEEGIDNAIDEAIVERLVKPFIEELTQEFKSRFPLPREANEREFCDLLRGKLEKWSQMYLPLLHFAFDNEYFRYFYEPYKQSGVNVVIQVIQENLVWSYHLERSIEKILDEKVYPAMGIYGLPMRVDKIVFTYDEMDRRPLRWIVVKRNRRLLGRYGLTERKKGWHNILVVNRHALRNLDIGRVDTRLVRLYLLLTHVVAGHPAFNYKGVFNFRTVSLGKKLQAGIKEHPYFDGLQFNFSGYPKDKKSLPNILDALCEMQAHKVTFTLTNEQNIPDEEKITYLDTLAIIYFTESVGKKLVGEYRGKQRIRAAHFAHITAMAKILNVDSELIRACTDKSIELNGRVYHNKLVRDLIKFYTKLILKKPESAPDVDVAPEDAAQQLREKTLEATAIATSA